MIYLSILNKEQPNQNQEIINLCKFRIMAIQYPKSWVKINLHIHNVGIVKILKDFSKILIPNLDPVISKILKETIQDKFSYVVHQDKPESIFLEFAPTPITRKHDCSLEQEFETQIKYALIDKTFYADQWTLRTNEEMENLSKNGFKIECFGSPFNSRLQYFGSIFQSDEPFGSLGDCLKILDTLIQTGELSYRGQKIISKNSIIKLVFSPSTYDTIILEIFKKLKILFRKRKCQIHFGMPDKFHALIKNGKKISNAFTYMLNQHHEVTPQNYCYSFHDQKLTPMRAVWYNYYFYNSARQALASH